MDIVRGLTTGLVVLFVYGIGIGITYVTSFGPLDPAYYTYAPVALFVIFAVIGTFKDITEEDSSDV
jgi:hypothetical protein